MCHANDRPCDGSLCAKILAVFWGQINSAGLGLEPQFDLFDALGRNSHTSLRPLQRGTYTLRDILSACRSSKMVAFAQVSVARDGRALFPCLTRAGFETQRVSFDPRPPPLVRSEEH